MDYFHIMDQMLNLTSCTLLATGRAGTDFLQSLLDSHDEVLTFNGALEYYQFWDNSKAAAAKNFCLDDFLNEFGERHIARFQSKFDVIERKDQLGENGDQCLYIDIVKFKAEAIQLLEGHEITAKTLLVGIYAAYAICLGQDPSKKKLLFHHAHTLREVERYLNDFPETKIICMTRDPRAMFVSGIENWRRYDPSKDRGLHLYVYLKRLMAGADVLKKFRNPYLVIRIEDLEGEDILRTLADWLGISYQESLTRSTWGGLLWHGDRISFNKAEGTSRKILRNQWEKKLSMTDQYLFNYLLANQLKCYGYARRQIRLRDHFLAPFLILWPLRYEWRFLSIGYIIQRLKRKEFRIMVSNMVCYFKRAALFYKYYWLAIVNIEYRHPYLRTGK